MKRIVFCFDGTWNRLDAKNVTNVVHTAQNISFLDKDGIAQIVHYDEGVGTKTHEKLRGGLFGMGLMDNLEEAYRFLVFNYDPGDEIYLFGFSRGAFSARTFAGLIFNCGIVNDVKKIPEALKLYKTRAHDDQHMLDKFRDFRLECSPKLCVDQAEFDWRVQTQNCQFLPINLEKAFEGLSDLIAPDLRILNIKYIGVWDTVGALGVPKSISLASVVNRRHEFHDCNLSTFVASARHAVAIDENRRSFEPTLWTNVDEMNELVEFPAESEKAPYQQRWFLGVHGSVGGGGDYTGLSDEALEWVWEGAKHLGLEFSTTRSSSIYKIFPDHTDHLVNVEAPKWYQLNRRVAGMLPKRPRSFVKDKTAKKGKRDIRPMAMHQLSMSTKYRWKAKAEELRSQVLYRPKLTLDHVSESLDIWDFKTVVSDDENPVSKPIKDALESKGASLTHTVVRGDTLSRIAKEYYEDSAKYTIIFEANKPMLTHEDRIYPGQVLVIPQLF